MNTHLTDYNESDRTDYMMVVASMAGIDGEVTSEEIFAIRELCMQFVLGPDARGKVMAAATTPPDDMDDILERLSHHALRYSLLLDLGVMAYKDEVLTEEELAEYNRLGRAMKVDEAHAKSVLKFAESLFAPGYTPAQAESSLESLEKQGVPRAAVTMSATMMALGFSPGLEVHR